MQIEYESDDVIKWNFWNYGICQDVLKEHVQEVYLPKMSISGQIVSEMLAGYTQKTPYKPF